MDHVGNIFAHSETKKKIHVCFNSAVSTGIIATSLYILSNHIDKFLYRHVKKIWISSSDTAVHKRRSDILGEETAVDVIYVGIYCKIWEHWMKVIKSKMVQYIHVTTVAMVSQHFFFLCNVQMSWTVFLEVKLTFEMLTVLGQQHSF